MEVTVYTIITYEFGFPEIIMSTESDKDAVSCAKRAIVSKDIPYDDRYWHLRAPHQIVYEHPDFWEFRVTIFHADVPYAE